MGLIEPHEVRDGSWDDHLRPRADEDENRIVYVVDVLKCNLEAIRVFQHCMFTETVVAGMGGAVLVVQGITAPEVRAVCEMLGIPQKRQPAILHKIRVMSDAAANYMNRSRLESRK